MKTQFPGYFSLSKDQIEELWNEGLFVFDANILLGLYRYSDSTRKEFLSTLGAFKDRCWLPHQAVKEYFENRLSVISKQEEAYAEIIKSMDDIEKKFKIAHQHPFLSSQSLERLCKDFELVREELKKSQSFHTDRINSDDVLAEIEKIFRDRVGPPYEEKDLLEIVAEGEERYKKNIPPGFRDGKKDDSSDPIRKYGDLVLWKQILRQVATAKVGVIFVSDDRKDDWWLQFKGRTLGPRPELVKEFAEVGGSNLLMYSPDRFLEFAGKHFDRAVSEGAVSEMRELIRFDEERKLRALEFKKRRREYEVHLGRMESQKLQLLKDLQTTELERSEMEHRLQFLMKRVNSEDPAALAQSDFEQPKEIAMRVAELERRILAIRDRVNAHVAEEEAIRAQLKMRGELGDAFERMA